MFKRLMGVICAAAIAGSAMGGDALAIDLRNEDGRAYQVRVKSSAMSKDLHLAAQSLSIIICVGSCSFYVPGIGEISAKGSDVVTIKHGRIVKNPARRVAEMP